MELLQSSNRQRKVLHVIASYTEYINPQIPRQPSAFLSIHDLRFNDKYISISGLWYCKKISDKYSQQRFRSIVPRREFSLPQKQFNLPLDFHRYFSSIQIQNIRSVVPHTKFSLPQKEFSLPLYRDSKIFKEVSTVF